jgi:hypothetical protein
MYTLIYTTIIYNIDMLLKIEQQIVILLQIMYLSINFLVITY